MSRKVTRAHFSRKVFFTDTLVVILFFKIFWNFFWKCCLCEKMLLACMKFNAFMGNEKKVAAKKKATVGTNVRISEKGYLAVRNYCKENGYNIGAFCEIAIMEKVQKEASEKFKV